MQNDPIGDKGGCLNWYVYVANNPVNGNDITGLTCCPSDVSAINSTISFQTNALNIINTNLRSGNNTWSNTGPITGTVIAYTSCYPRPHTNFNGIDITSCLGKCVKAHEDVHLKNCGIFGWWGNIYNASPAGEKEAYSASLKCLQAALVEARSH